MFAREEAKGLRHSNLCGEHLLFGLLAVGASAVSYECLSSFSVDLRKIREKVSERISKSNRPVPDDLPFTADAKVALQAAFEHARSRGLPVEIDSGDMLLGLIDDQDAPAVHLLKELGVDRQELRMTVIYKRMASSGVVVKGDCEMSDEEAMGLLHGCHRVVAFAADEAVRLGHGSIGTEMILMGLAGAGGSVAKVLEEFGATPDVVRKTIESVVGSMPKLIIISAAPAGLPFSPRAKQLFKNSMDEAVRLGHDAITPRHLLLGMLHERDSVAFQVLNRLKVDFAELRKAGLKLFADGPE